MAEKFSGGLWIREPVNIFATRWFAYADSWETLLSAWEDEVFTVIWPGSPLPFAELAACLR